MAYKIGDGWFSGGDGGNGGDDRTEYERLIHKVGLETLNNLQKLIVQLVKARDGNALTALQACYGKLFEQASECMAADKDMGIE